MERDVGDQFEYNGVTLEVVQVENFSCKGCYFIVCSHGLEP